MMRASLKVLDPTCNYCFSSNENSDDGLEDVSGILLPCCCGGVSR
jgi:hypothetical protein